MQVTLEELLKAGVHFGHQVKRWNPHMKDYIYTERNGVHIIDLSKTIEAMEKAAAFIEAEIAKGKEIIFVGTKRQAQEVIKKEALRCGSMYLNNRWPGGLVSNYKSIKNTIERYKKMIEMKKSNETERMTKKDLAVFNKDFERKDKLIGGIKDLNGIPELLFVLDIKREENAIKEARMANIPVVAICDTNSNPELVTYAIPGNDDAVRSIQLFVSFIADVVEKGRQKRKTIPQKVLLKPEEKIVKNKVKTSLKKSVIPQKEETKEIQSTKKKTERENVKEKKQKELKLNQEKK